MDFGWTPSCVLVCNTTWALLQWLSVWGWIAEAKTVYGVRSSHASLTGCETFRRKEKSPHWGVWKLTYRDRSGI